MPFERHRPEKKVRKRCDFECSGKIMVSVKCSGKVRVSEVHEMIRCWTIMVEIAFRVVDKFLKTS